VSGDTLKVRIAGDGNLVSEDGAPYRVYSEYTPSGTGTTVSSNVVFRLYRNGTVLDEVRR
jgi:hypothetical protein